MGVGEGANHSQTIRRLNNFMGTIIKYPKNKNHISPSSEEDTTTTLS